MPYPVSRAAAFGISPRSYEDWFPTSRNPAGVSALIQADPRIASDLAYANQQDQDEVENLDTSTPEGISGLQRLVGIGAVTPRKANSIIAAGRLGNTKSRTLDQDATDFMREFYKIAPNSPNEHEQVSGLLDKYPQAPMHPVVDRYLQQRWQSMNGRPQLDAANIAHIQKGYSDLTRDISDEEKQKAFKKQTGSDIATDEDWKKAWHLVKDPRKAKLVSDINSIERIHGKLPDSLQQIRNEIALGGDGNSSQSTEEAKPSASTPAPSGAPSHVTAPNGKVYYFKTPEQAAVFKAKAGL